MGTYWQLWTGKVMAKWIGAFNQLCHDYSTTRIY